MKYDLITDFDFHGMEDYLEYLYKIMMDRSIPEINKVEVNKEFNRIAKELSVLQSNKLIIKAD